jgi:hypothetical protein
MYAVSTPPNLKTQLSEIAKKFETLENTVEVLTSLMSRERWQLFEVLRGSAARMIDAGCQCARRKDER